MIHCDSSFLVDFLREMETGRPGGALDFIESLDEKEILAASVHALAEIRAGVELSRNPIAAGEAADAGLSALLVVYPDDRFAGQYGRLYAAIRRRGQPMDAMDLLIATAAILDDAPLVTRNVRHFARVPGLRLIDY